MSRRTQELLAILTDQAAAKNAPKPADAPPAAGTKESAAPAADDAKGKATAPEAKN